MVILEIKITVFTLMLSDEGCDSFPKHLDLALAPNKTNEGVKALVLIVPKQLFLVHIKIIG